MLILTAILPVFAVVFGGYLLRQYHLRDESFWQTVDQLIYRFLLPALIIQALAGSQIEFTLFKFGGLVFSAITCAAALVMLIKPLIDPNKFTALFQGSVRSNFYIAFSIATIMFEKEGLQLISFALLFLILSSVIYSLIVLQIYGRRPKGDQEIHPISRLVQNPIIIATLIGLSISVLLGPLPGFIDETLRIFGRATLPLALMGIGASLKLGNVRDDLGVITTASFIRLIITPAIALIGSYYFGLSQLQAICAILLTGTPAAASSVTFASQMGGNKTLVSVIVTSEVILSVLTLPLFVYLTKIVII